MNNHGTLGLTPYVRKRQQYPSDHPCPRPGCGGSALYQWDSDEGPTGDYVLICESCRREIKEL
jgi:hypothetical protein